MLFCKKGRGGGGATPLNCFGGGTGGWLAYGDCAGRTGACFCLPVKTLASSAARSCTVEDGMGFCVDGLG